MSAPILRKLRKPLELSSWITFAISLSFYWITVDPGVSYWDCPEYVTIASRMEIGHPPGNPVWMLAMRVATMPFSPENHAFIINLCSGLLMAFASFFLCRIIFLFTRVSFLLNRSINLFSRGFYDVLSIFIAIGASLCFSLCDSVWFSAVEAEVYAISTFLVSVNLWIMTVWWWEKSHSRKVRLLILLAYITGISLGVHQLNLLLIPVFALVVLYRQHPGKINPLFLLSVIISSIALIGLILMGLIPGLLSLSEHMELFGVNILGMPYDSGLIIFWFLLLLSFLIAIRFTTSLEIKKRNFISPSTFIWMAGFLILGFSSFAVILLRSKSSPAMNEGTPDNIFALTSYMQREQYPQSPLLYGQTPYSRPLFEESVNGGRAQYSRYLLKKEKPLYQPVLKDAKLNHRSRMVSKEDSLANRRVMEKGEGYILTDYKFSQVLTPELNMWFPRITSRNPGDRLAYKDWAGMSEDNMDKISISETLDSAGQYQPRMNSLGMRDEVYSLRPTYLQNLRYFIAYQSYYMYFRYLFWNFIGRQNDYPSTGEIEHGNFITGISVIDRLLPGNTPEIPEELGKSNKGRNRYFGIPFLFGIGGILWLCSGRSGKRRFMAVSLLLFIMTGIAIVAYLNQTPGEPRERDYTFLANYLTFAIWIGAGLTGLFQVILKWSPKKFVVVLLCIISLCPATLMALENFDDHDRRGRFEPTFYASGLLDFEIPAIIFSQGDNSTFPLWYATEVLRKGEKHVPVDVTYLSLPSYVTNLKKQGNFGIKTLGKTPDIAFGKYLLTRIPSDSSSVPQPLEDVLNELYNSKTPDLSVSSVKIKSHDGEAIVNLHDFAKGGNVLSFKQLMLLDMIASMSVDNQNHKDSIISKRILFFPYLIEHSFYSPLDSLLKPALFGKIYAPDISETQAIQLMKKSVERELVKLRNVNVRSRYVDPVIADRTVRYRGELIIAANELLQNGDVKLPLEISNVIEEVMPYSDILPGSFTISDSTFYEGKEYVSLLKKLFEVTSDPVALERSENLQNKMDYRHKEWLRYYESLSSEEHRLLSNRSKRLLIKN